MSTNLQFIKSASGSGVTTLSVTDCFSSNYDVYFLQVTKANFASNAYVWTRFLDSSGSLISASEYEYATLDMYANTSFAELKGTGQSSIPNLALSQSGIADFGGIEMYIYNPYDSSSYTFVTAMSSTFSTNGRGSKLIGVHKSAEQLSGIELNRSAGDAFDMKINMYGVK
jgi:hypothetical protein